MVDGKIRKSGDASLAKELEESGYAEYQAKAA
jgi:Fe-S cluster assembly ATPase SufC